MLSDKELKKWFAKQTTKKPEVYFPINTLKKLGYNRHKCKSCGKYFWSIHKGDVCGEPECEGGYSFIGRKHNPMDFVEVWKRFSKMLSKTGYTPVKRYPVVARWNPTMEFTLASIADFQPYVVSGEVEPPAKKLVVPQLCLRFNDIDNVGITGRHNTGFTMIGQHAFLPKKEFDQGQLFLDYYQWYTKGMKLKPEEFKIHEDAWAGGGNYGPCLEFFSGGLEIGNQVYMYYEQTAKGGKELGLRVLDMGMGQERPAWFSQGTTTVYEAAFPDVCKRLFKETGIKPEHDILKKFIPLSGYLNVDEVEDVEKVWNEIAKKIGVDVNQLKEAVLPSAAVYSIGDHTRALLYALSDGAIPSNVGGSYNLRVLYRRIMGFSAKYGWKVDVHKLIEMHAKYLKPEYPELSDNLSGVRKILEVEERKYLETKKRNSQIISQVIKKQIPVSKMIELYDSNGISPEEIGEEALKIGKKVKVPDNFYARLAERHEKKEVETQTKKEITLDVDKYGPTNLLYFDHYDLAEGKADVLYVKDNYVVLDQTIFYPTSGGQANDLGTVGKEKVLDVFKQGSVVVHLVAAKPSFKRGDVVDLKIDFDRRLQLAQHHTAAHIINGAARRVLGEHIWQAGAAKTIEKGRLDITHYDTLTEGEIEKIEVLSNDIVAKNLPVFKSFLPRNIAEAKYGFRLYQGGAVPGKKIRVVEIPGFDVEACGGTHLNTTGEAALIKILRTSKIQDGVIRLEFAAGKAAQSKMQGQEGLLIETADLLGCKVEQIPYCVKELFELWKTVRKAMKKGVKLSENDLKLKSKESYNGDVLQETARILRTQPEHINNTIKRFLKDVEDYKKG
ncbi:MAG: alanine--tRNA ligase [archaeon]